VSTILPDLGRIWGGGRRAILRLGRDPLAPVGGDLPHRFVEIVSGGVALVGVIDPQVGVTGLPGADRVRDRCPAGVGDPAAAEAVEVELVAVGDAQGLDGTPKDVADDTAIERLARVREGVEDELPRLPERDERHCLRRDCDGLRFPPLGVADEDLVGRPVHVLSADLADGADPAAAVGQDREERQPEALSVVPKPVQHSLKLLGPVGALLDRGLLQLLDLGPGDVDQFPLVGPVPSPSGAAHVEVGRPRSQGRLLGQFISGAGDDGSGEAGGPDVLEPLQNVGLGADEGVDRPGGGLPVLFAEGEVLLVDLHEEGVGLERELRVQLQSLRLGLLLRQRSVIGSR